jgi:hypothetical protein
LLKSSLARRFERGASVPLVASEYISDYYGYTSVRSRARVLYFSGNNTQHYPVDLQKLIP